MFRTCHLLLADLLAPLLHDGHRNFHFRDAIGYIKTLHRDVPASLLQLSGLG